MADFDRENVGNPLVRPAVPLAAGVTVGVGDILVRDVQGYARPRTSAALVATDRFCGVATEAVDNSAGAAGAKTVPCDYARAIWLDNADVNPPVVTDDQAYVYDREHVCTFRTAGGVGSVNVPCGTILQFTATKSLVLVGIGSQRDIDRRVEILEGY